MITVAEHTYEETLLPEKANILDLGCRGFLFADAMVELGHKLFAVDPDFFLANYHRLAISNYIGKACLQRSNDPQATSIKRSFGKLADTSEMVDVTTLQQYSKDTGVGFWDLIKIDIEGSEYEVIMSLTEPPAKQLSIEFHLHTKIYGESQVKEMENKLLSLGYYPAKHDKTSEHGCGLNFWDSLWILK